MQLRGIYRLLAGRNQTQVPYLYLFQMSPRCQKVRSSQLHYQCRLIGNVPPDVGTTHSIGLPVHIYPLYENGFRAHRGQSLQENDIESAKLYAEFAQVSEKNPLSWNFGQPAASEETIRTVTARNRMICFPCEVFPRASRLLR